MILVFALLCLTSVRQSGDNDAAASSGCDHKAGLDDGDDGQALRLRDHMSCNIHTKMISIKTRKKVSNFTSALCEVASCVAK